eukprot:scaffold218277_cov32-Tisochrysis_lutea.AAC.1
MFGISLYVPVLCRPAAIGCECAHTPMPHIRRPLVLFATGCKYTPFACKYTPFACALGWLLR